MSRPGLILTRLTLTGAGVPEAEVRFSTGLNVISGPSDTGKTYIAQCIDFMLGGSGAPKDIPQAGSYESVLLGLCTPGREAELVLERSLRGGDFRLHRAGQETQTLGARHQAGNENTVSHLLLSLADLAGRKVQKNKRGTTRHLSFRDLSRLAIVDEETVISERSPILSGQHTSKTAELSVFRMLLTGVDDSSVIAHDDPRITRSRSEGKHDVVHDLVARRNEEIAALDVEGDAVALQAQLDQAEARFEAASSELAADRESASDSEQKRREAWEGLRQVESRLDVLSELQRRFELLQEQYTSDLRRLKAISEAGGRLGQMIEERCPVCGARAEYHDRQHQCPHATPEEVAWACQAEADKISVLLTDLQQTLTENAAEVRRLAAERETHRAELQSVGSELRDQLQPRVRAALQRLQESQAERDACKKGIELHSRVAELEAMLREDEPTAEARQEPATVAQIGGHEIEQFSKHVESLLRDWHFPNLDRVTFSETDHDILISGQRRASHGKGVRAITHAAFNLALLRYCWDASMPHPGFAVIDSPLVVYREPDTDEGEFTHDVKDAFYRSLAGSFRDAQVIVLENEDPPPDVESSANVIRFTGTSHARKGFIPEATSTT